ncbi:MAG: UDP-N-acetylmuramoyl-L-alanine--D-glutamate ligase [Acidobacteria bacterium]|nr:UDP-N-acetylmuramoyl-L-alanine--D-glutamate ligase [Acidobacteriota bacterium]
MGTPRNVLVVGLGRSGCAAARHLLARGERVTGTDMQPVERLGREAAALAEANVRLVCGAHDENDFVGADLLVVSPGVPLDIPPIAAARARGVPVISEIDLVAGAVGERLIAITGSNGKTTTTALVAAMLSAAGREGVPCGNYGTPLVDAVQGDHPDRWYALEISSFQLETTSSLRAAGAVLLNVQADHLDRHGSYLGYREAKWRIAALRAGDAPLVLNADDPDVAPLGAQALPPVLEVSVERAVAAGGFQQGDELRLRTGHGEELLARSGELQLPGRHNRVNVLAAAVACRALDLPLDALHSAATSFRPLPHRLQEVALVGGVRYVDDSKGTNVGSVLVALEAIRENLGPLPPAGPRIHVLLGGRDKSSDFRPLAHALARAGSTPLAFGEAGPRIALALEGEGVAVERCGSLEDAVQRAAELARPGDVVLLSPACASFDAFSGYAARGDAFAAAARRLAGDGR